MNANENYLVQIEGWRGAVRQPVTPSTDPVVATRIFVVQPDGSHALCARYGAHQRSETAPIPVEPAA
jgi:hypothetical protein